MQEEREYGWSCKSPAVSEMGVGYPLNHVDVVCIVSYVSYVCPGHETPRCGFVWGAKVGSKPVVAP